MTAVATRPGPPGPAGPSGPAGPPGPAGPSGSDVCVFRYVHNQVSAASTWTVSHNLGGYPSVSVIDSAGSRVFGDARYIDTMTVQLNFSAPFSGQAVLS